MQHFDKLPYERLDFAAEKLRTIDLIDQFKKANTAAHAIELVEVLDKIFGSAATKAQIASVRHSINTEDPFYDAERQHYDEIGPELKNLNMQLYDAVLKSNHLAQIEARFGKQYITIAKLTVESMNAKIVDDLKLENKFGSEYTKLIASAKINFRGEEMNLSQLDALVQSDDRHTRKEATEAKFSFYSENSVQLDRIYDDLVKTRHKMATKLGYENFVDFAYKRLLRSEYNNSMVASYRKQIREVVVPLAQQLYKEQFASVEIDDAKHYDLNYYFKNGNPAPIGTPEEIVQNASKMYNELSPETAEFFGKMTSLGLMDLVTKKGKAGGGYCTSFSEFKLPFIFSNFNGTYGDIDVLTHEAGHAFQVYNSFHFDVQEYFWPTYEACEIHSMSMEFFTYPWMKLFFGDRTDEYKLMHLRNSIYFLPYGVLVDEFQHWVYENPNATPAERNQQWRKLEKIYTPWKDYDGFEYLENGGFWQRQQHIYNSAFYYIDYTLAQICAFQFWNKSVHDFESAWADYLHLCKAGGSKPFLELVELAGLQSPFEDGAVKQALKPVEEFIGVGV